MSPELSSSFSDCGYYMPMRAVQTVEIAYADDGRLPVGRDFIETAEDAHQISNSSFMPSYARRTFDGRWRFVSACARSWDICTKKARRGFSRSTILTDSSSEECVGCGRRRNASRNRTSKFWSTCMVGSGIELKSVR